jgi:hypothetical protein
MPTTSSCIKFAGAEFVLKDLVDGVVTYTSDDAAAKSSVAMLESMGLAGKWQTAGAIRLSIQNSGPPGAAVSLKFQLPSDQTLASSSTALQTWGIELSA